VIRTIVIEGAIDFVSDADEAAQGFANTNTHGTRTSNIKNS
jgi:hypothetical protein